jgi:hypothetical protein
VNKPKITGPAIAYYVMFAVIVATIVYTKWDTGRQVDASEARQVDRNTAQLACLNGAFEDFLTGNQALRDASARRDDALLLSKLTMARITELRIGERKDDDPKLRAKIRKHMPEALSHYGDVSLFQKKYVQTVIDYSETSDALTEARRDYRLPDFEKRCGKLEPGFRGAWYRHIAELDPQPYPAGLSVER